MPDPKVLSKAYFNEIVKTGAAFAAELKDLKQRFAFHLTLDGNYEVEEDDVELVGADLELKEGFRNLDVDGPWKAMQVSSLWVDKPPDYTPPYFCHCSPGAVLIRALFAKRDTNETRMRASEIIWQSYLISIGLDPSTPIGRDPVDLTYIALCDVENDSSHTAVWFGAKELTRTSDGQAMEREKAGQRVYTEYDHGYYAILGSELGKVIWYLLSDHKRDLGYRRIAKIVVFPCLDGNGNLDPNGPGNEKRKRNLTFVLTPPAPGQRTLAQSGASET